MSIFASPDVRTPADPQDYETTQSKMALPPVEFNFTTGATLNTFKIQDRQFPAQRGPTQSYRIYFLPITTGPMKLSDTAIRQAGHRMASLVAEVPTTGRGDTLTVTDTQFFGQSGWYYCVGVNKRGIESPPEHLVHS